MHTLDFFRRSEGYEPDILVFLQCTSPLTAPADIDGVIEAMEREGADTALTVVPFHYFLWQRDDSGDGTGINHDKRVRPLRQDREPQYLESGAIYVMKAAGFRDARHRFFGKTALYEMPHELAGRSMIRSTWRSPRSCFDPDRRPIAGPCSPKNSTRLFSTSMVSSPTIALPCWKKARGGRVQPGDGMGIELLRKAGWPMIVLSKETHPIVSARCAKLRLECQQGVDDKLPALRRWIEDRGFALERTLYVGNDINDLACLTAVGCSVVVAEITPRRRAARIILEKPGGQGPSVSWPS